MLFVKTPYIVKQCFTKLTWDIPTREKEVYLTFDDGPTPEITEWVMDQLALYNAKATFFCIGKNIEENPDIFKKILQNGHSIGNHTYNHLNAWKTNSKTYLSNTKKTEESILKLYPDFAKHKLFRPPYGKFTPSLINQLKRSNYNIIAWDIISEDYDKNLPPEKVFNNVKNNISPGSIIVFHDSVKAFNNLEPVLPAVLYFLKEQGYTSRAL